MRNATLKAFVIAIALLLAAKSSFAAPDVAKGKSLYEANCTTCHKVHEKYTGPALYDAGKRWSSETNLIKWIKNSQAFLKTGDAYATKLYKEYNNSVMPAHEFLSDDDVRSILAYVQTVPKPVAPVVADGAGGVAAEPTLMSQNALLGIVIALALGILGLLAFIQTRMQGILGDSYAKAQGDYEDIFRLPNLPRLSPLNRVGLVLTVLGALFTFAYLYGYYEVGMQQGYAPVQPIAYSHELHAGKYQIECTYCHTGAERGKSATIPASNVCMNCHNVIKKDSPEIQKIYAARASGKPIQWIRIHNVPDYAYFNHYQHYKIAGIKCQKCHGPIEKMKVVKQYAPLTMGWCIECHTQTKVNVSNGYYQSVHKDYLNSPEAKKKGVTISQFGGMECSKCHY
jgi:mono/diheme cytochrome c family protein